MVDLEEGDRWIELGESRAWNWQQGCMLQWLPGSRREVIWNDRQGDRFVCHILDIRTGQQRTLPAPIYCVSPDGRWAVAPDFRRLNDCRPGYGYAGLPDPNREVLAPEDAGIWRIDLHSAEQTLIFSFADAARLASPPLEGVPQPDDWAGAKHWFNHLLFSPDGSRFIFLHRWRGEKEGQSFSTRLFTAGLDGKDLYILDPYGQTSHFIWRDPEHVLAWAWHPSHGEKFYLYRDRTDRVTVVAPEVMTVNGHCSYLPGGEWILNDTYPDAERRSHRAGARSAGPGPGPQEPPLLRGGFPAKSHRVPPQEPPLLRGGFPARQHLYLYHVPGGQRYPLGEFYAPPEYRGEWRCDLHPRCSPDGRRVVIDSAHEGNGRQMYLMDVGEIVG
jgi:hypothetical protein